MRILFQGVVSVIVAVVLSHTAFVVAQQPPPAELDRYNVVWTTPGANAAGSMPIGNGEVGLNVWVEENGDLLFYVSRTDAWSECNRLLKLGRVRVSFSPSLLGKDRRFRQELVLRDGRIDIRTDDAEIGVFVDAAAPVVYVVGRCKTPTTVTARLESWRTEKRVLKGEELRSSWTMQEAPDSIEVWESPDVVDSSAAGAIVWHHRNQHSVVPLTLKHQGLESLAGAVRDPLIGRTFGGIMRGQGFAVAGPGALETERPVERFALSIATHAAQTESADQWKREAAALADATDAQKATERTARWWSDFWNRSWIFVSGGDEAETARVTQSYIMQRWIAACGGRGNYPIKFNGSIFTVDPKYSGGPDFNPDWRRWGDCYWWQNTRLPYFAMIASGDFDGLDSVFRLYRDVLPLCRARAKLYYDAEGAYFPETMTIFGTYANRDYGWDRTGKQPNDVACKYWRYSWQQGLELAALMLDYHEYTEDDRFLREELIPMARDVLRYYESRFCRDGKMTITPTQSVETYWFDVVNDTPSVAGLRDVLGRLLAIPPKRTPPAEREFWTKLLAATPPLPLGGEKGKLRVLPAEKFNPKRNNCENPELYAIWPFQFYGVGRPDLPVGVETFHRRIEKASIGWQYDGQCAAIVGLADEAKRILLKKVGNSNPKHRFPAMWGPNYDWVPDQDHGSNILLTLQHMALASAGDRVHLLPAWPKDWNVSFKLRAPRNTVVECVYRNGRIEKLDVSPESRRKDVQPPKSASNEQYNLSPEEAKEGFISLFDGRTLDGWQGDVKGYAVEDGAMVCRPGGSIFTKKEYADFVLRFEFKLPPGGNNGVGIRTPLKGTSAYAGMEIQILDDGHPKYKDLHDYQAHGSIYGVVPAKRGHLKPAGQWNREEIVADGGRIKVTLNGTVILDADISKIDKTMDGQPHPGLHNVKGHVGWLGHGDPVAFRNVRIKEIGARD